MWLKLKYIQNNNNNSSSMHMSNDQSEYRL